MRKYASEVFRQAGILILSSGLIIWLMQFVIGSECGLEANYTLKQIGAPLYSGILNAFCSLREMAPYMYAYIFAAKVWHRRRGEARHRVSWYSRVIKILGRPSTCAAGHQRGA